MTERRTGMAMAPGPTGVSGIIDEDTTWYAGRSPYVIEAPVEIADKTVLTVESGTVIHSVDAGILVKGSLISFDKVKDKTNILRFCQIRDAETAIEILSGSPVIEDCELIDNRDGIKVRDAFSTPGIVRNSIHQNRGTGGYRYCRRRTADTRERYKK